MRRSDLLAILVCLISAVQVFAQSKPAAGIARLGDLASGKGWTGLTVSGGAAVMDLPGEASFTYSTPAPDGEHPHQGDWKEWHSLQFDINLPDERPVTIEVTLRSSKGATHPPSIAATVQLAGEGWHAVSLPWSAFPLPRQSDRFLENIHGINLRAHTADEKPAAVKVRDVRIVRAQSVWLSAPVRGQPVAPGNATEYTVTVSNCTDRPQAVAVSFERNGYEAMTPSVEPKLLQLQAGGSAEVIVKVDVPARVPPGARETQTLVAIANGKAEQSARLPLTSVGRLEHPFIVHTKDRWDVVRENVKKYDWAQDAQKGYLSQADKWNVPGVRNPKDPKRGDWLFQTQVEHDLMAAGISYQLTGEKEYAEKVRQFLLNLSNPSNGYPVTRRGCHQSSVQEGHFFQHIAMAYDMAIPSGVFTDADRQQIDQTLRLFVGPSRTFAGQISNWTVSYQCGQLYSALVLQDLEAAEALLFGKGGLMDQFRYGTLDDGWWYEVSISYSIWCATEFSQVALAMRPWGYDLANASFPADLRPNDELPPEREEYGMSKARWGPIHHNNITLKRVWDALPSMVDYRGQIFGLNDSSAKSITGPQMDIAYYLYRDPAYAPLIKRGGGRNLLYAVPELPENGPDPSTQSTYADNVGVAVLRSQTDGIAPRERIQAILRYGDHGYFHGHFDRTELLHLSRYGRSFYNPSWAWYGYPNYMYKFYMQTSVTKNMVVVDQKMQEPVESQRLFFHSGKLMQATAVQSSARWSNPPYGGMVYHDQPHKTFADKALAEGRSVPVPENPPKYGTVTGYTEPILQRRVMVVTDDYVVLADYVKGEKEHTFESLLQMRGFQGLDSADKKLVRHNGQWNPDPIGSAQFVTDCDWYEAAAPVRGSFVFRFGPGADTSGGWVDASENGVLNMDVHTLWPAKQEIMLGTPAETLGVNKQVTYAVRGDGKPLAEGKSGMWILGEVGLDVPVEGVTSLELETQAGGSPTLFWAGGRVVTTDGREIALSSLPVRFDNTRQPKEPGKDYEGGPIKIAGLPYAEAVPAQPQDGKKPSVVRVDLTGLNAARFKCVLGGDFPIGDESQRRKTVAQRQVGTSARFLTVIEPFEEKRTVKSARASGADTLQVELIDGRTQAITIQNLEGPERDIAVSISESRDGKVVRTEATRAH